MKSGSREEEDIVLFLERVEFWLSLGNWGLLSVTSKPLPLNEVKGMLNGENWTQLVGYVR